MEVSPSARKVWIEIDRQPLGAELPGRHLLRGRCGLKFVLQLNPAVIQSVTFCEEGVDWTSRPCQVIMIRLKSPSARKVWIEMIILLKNENEAISHLLRGRCGLKWPSGSLHKQGLKSPSARKVWIEMLQCTDVARAKAVTFCEEGVDWNHLEIEPFEKPSCYLLRGRCGLKFSDGSHTIKIDAAVTFCEEGVDWNVFIYFFRPIFNVTFCEEGVDWNGYVYIYGCQLPRSPSVRKVWIEISRNIWIGITISPLPTFLHNKKNLQKANASKGSFFW